MDARVSGEAGEVQDPQKGNGSNRNGHDPDGVAGFSRPANRLLGFWVVLVSVLGPGVGVCPPETPLEERRRRHTGAATAPIRWGTGSMAVRRPPAAEAPSAGGFDRPPTAATRPMASPASAVPFEWVLAGGVEAAVVGRVVDG